MKYIDVRSVKFEPLATPHTAVLLADIEFYNSVKAKYSIDIENYVYLINGFNCSLKETEVTHENDYDGYKNHFFNWIKWKQSIKTQSIDEAIKEAEEAMLKSRKRKDLKKG